MNELPSTGWKDRINNDYILKHPTLSHLSHTLHPTHTLSQTSNKSLRHSAHYFISILVTMEGANLYDNYRRRTRERASSIESETGSYSQGGRSRSSTFEATDSKATKSMLDGASNSMDKEWSWKKSFWNAVKF